MLQEEEVGGCEWKGEEEEARVGTGKEGFCEAAYCAARYSSSSIRNSSGISTNAHKPSAPLLTKSTLF